MHRLRFALLWCGGVDLRLTLLAVPPVLPLIHRALGLNEVGVAALSNVPVLLLSAAAIPGSLAISRLGVRGALVAALWLIAVASMLRGVGASAPTLFAMTFLMGVGIATAQTALPTLVAAWFPERVGTATGVWANGLLCGEALSASLTIPLVLPLVAGAWGPALAVWGIPVAATAIAFGFLRGEERTVVRPLWFPDFRDARVWRIGLFQSAASLTYFGANTFIPDYLHAAGRAELVGPCLAALNIGQLPATLVIGLVPLRVLARRITSTVVAVLLVGALIAFGFVAVPAVAVAAATAFGLGGAYVLAFSFALPAFLARGPEVTRIAAGTNTIGYAIAFAATIVTGALWDAYRQPALACVPVVASAIIVLVLGSRLGAAALAAGRA